MQSMIAEAIMQGIAAGLKQFSRPTAAIPDMVQPQGRVPVIAVEEGREVPSERYTPERSIGSQSDISEEEGQLDLDLSDDEGISPDLPVSSGLFQPGLLKSLLFKAKNMANLGTTPPVSSDHPQGQKDPLFEESTSETEVIPSPQIFVDAV